MSRQSGVVLVVSLLMLALLSVLTITALHTDTAQLRVIANQQDDLSLEALTQAELNRFAGQADRFQERTCDPAPFTPAPDYTVDLDEPRCLQAHTEPGSSDLSATAPEQALWELRIKGQDNRSGNEITLHQGLLLSGQPRGQCPLATTGLPC